MTAATEIRYTAAADGVAIAYESLGTGPPLLYARAWISNLELQRDDPAIERFFAPLRAHRRVIRYDTRGNGVSEWALDRPITKDDLLADLDAVADTIEEPTFDLWATTYAGPLAIEYVANHSERVDRIILDGTFARGHEFLSPARAESFFEMLKMARTTPDVVFSSLSFMTDPAPEISHETRVERLRASISPTAIEQLYRLAWDFDVNDLLAQIAQPVLVLHRAGSRAVPIRAARRLAARLPAATLRVLDGNSHNLYEGNWKEALSAVGEFLGFEAVTGPLLAENASSPLQVVLFTDIVGSTEMTADLGDARAQSLLHAHDEIVRSALMDHAGTEIKHTGDGIMASFRGVSDAARASLQICHDVAALRGHPLQVRIGLNAGEPVAERGDLFGRTVQIAARVCDRAGTNEIVVTDVVRELLRGKQMSLDDLGVHELRGVDGAIRLWRLIGTGRTTPSDPSD